MSEPTDWLADETTTKTEVVTNYSIKITKARMVQLLRSAGVEIPLTSEVDVLIQGIPYEPDWELENTEGGTHLEVRWQTKETSSGRT